MRWKYISNNSQYYERSRSIHAIKDNVLTRRTRDRQIFDEYIEKRHKAAKVLNDHVDKTYRQHGTAETPNGRGSSSSSERSASTGSHNVRSPSRCKFGQTQNPRLQEAKLHLVVMLCDFKQREYWASHFCPRKIPPYEALTPKCWRYNADEELFKQPREIGAGPRSIWTSQLPLKAAQSIRLVRVSQVR